MKKAVPDKNAIDRRHTGLPVAVNNLYNKKRREALWKKNNQP